MNGLARIGLKIPKLSYDQLPQSNHRHYLTRVASYNGNLFALGDYDDEHNHAEIYHPLSVIGQRSTIILIIKSEFFSSRFESVRVHALGRPESDGLTQTCL